MSNLFLLDLPLDVLYNIFKNLNLRDFRNVMLTCKKFRKLILEDTILWKNYSTNELVIIKARNSYDYITWYNKCRISHNWCKGIYKDKIILQHKVNFMPWLRVWEQYLFLSIGSDLFCYPPNNKGMPVCKKWVWKLNVPHKPRGNINVRSKLHDISRFKIRQNHIVCGNRDGSLIVYRYDDIQCRPQLQNQIFDCHDQGNLEVSAVELIDTDENYTVISSCYKDPFIKLWHANELDSKYQTSDLICVQEIKLTECIGAKCMCLNKNQNKLAAGLDGNRIPVIIDTETGTVFENDSKKDIFHVVRDIQWHTEQTLVYVTHSGHLQCMDIRTLQIVYSATDPFQSSLYCVRSDGHHALIVGSAQYARCVLYDVRIATRHKQMYFTQKKCSPIYSLDFDTTKLLAAADRSVAAIDFNVAVHDTQARNYQDVFQFV